MQTEMMAVTNRERFEHRYITKSNKKRQFRCTYANMS